jgi:tetratricopeptide (TPR) repeat protein
MVGGCGAVSTDTLSQTELGRLREEREHLLASLDDLDAERAAGDIDDLDYETLRDDYTARAAQLTRVLDGAAVRRAPKKSNPRSSQIKWIATVLVIAAAASWAMVEFSGARGTGETASGEIRQGTTTLLANAAQAFGGGDPERAIELYGEVLDLQPTNVEALTYRGWISYQTGDVDGARADFDEAVAFDAEYGDVRVFRAIVALDEERFGDASDELAAFDQSNPTAIARDLVAQRQVRERIGVARMAELLDETDGLPDLEANNVGIAEAQLAGELFVRLEDPQRALRSFDAVLELEPDNADALAWHGWTLALLAESGAEELFVDAEEWLGRSVEADPSNPDARVFLAFIFNRLDRADEARAELEAFDAIENPPADMVALIDQFGLRDALG